MQQPFLSPHIHTHPLDGSPLGDQPPAHPKIHLSHCQIVFHVDHVPYSLQYENFNRIEALATWLFVF
ncbi:hypothetical protein BDV41DRAFT_552868 [Aspergillus transmontanensis]|uniref:Uncharacterized protein n=1 Tax=Aspergillus transmontanensis TaxID=1034304 RepID=A0A5N6VHX1_9EURO|nr:hypothetical protein BDV41DRAFT_552868 [Aspergillus transmontanensis]